MTDTTTTKYGVARGERIIGDLFEDVDTARRHLVWVEEQAASIGLESDARLVTVDIKTTTGRPHVYKDPTPEDETPEADVPQGAGDTSEPLG